jgi:ABC-type Fe3+-hydroxamate transport system substrate-binding protein
MQASLADKLIRAGLNVLVTNQRSVAEIFQTLRLVAGLVGQQERSEAWIAQCQARHAQIAQAARAWPRRPRVYFEEWDEPMISAIRWVSELVTVAGLLSGGDLLRAVQEAGGVCEGDILLLPGEALNADDLFIDSLPLAELVQSLAPARVVPGFDIPDALRSL